MRVLNVNSTLGLKTGGGTAERTFQMSHFLAKEGLDCTVLTLNISLDLDRIEAIKPAKVIALPCFMMRYYIPWTSSNYVRHLVEGSDIVHLMGHWGALNAILYFAIRRAGKPYVVCPAGALALYGRSKWLKRLYNFFVGNKIISNASGWIAVTSNELQDFENYGIPASKVTVIPNGICKEDFPLVDINAFRHSKLIPDSPIILFMGRLNSIKGPDLLLRAFASINKHIQDYLLVFAGPDEGMQSYLVDIAKQEGVNEKVCFLGFVGGNEKSAAYRMANLLVVPSRKEAMSIVALEAGICGTPVLLTDQCGFSEIKSIDPGLEVSASVEGIAVGLVHLLTNPILLKEVGLTFESFVSQKYTWDFIVNRYLNLYKDILEISETKR